MTMQLMKGIWCFEYFYSNEMDQENQAKINDLKRLYYLSSQETQMVVDIRKKYEC